MIPRLPKELIENKQNFINDVNDCVQKLESIQKFSNEENNIMDKIKNLFDTFNNSNPGHGDFLARFVIKLRNVLEDNKGYYSDYDMPQFGDDILAIHAPKGVSLKLKEGVEEYIENMIEISVNLQLIDIVTKPDLKDQGQLENLHKYMSFDYKSLIKDFIFKDMELFFPDRCFESKNKKLDNDKFQNEPTNYDKLINFSEINNMISNQINKNKFGLDLDSKLSFDLSQHNLAHMIQNVRSKDLFSSEKLNTCSSILNSMKFFSESPKSDINKICDRALKVLSNAVSDKVDKKILSEREMFLKYSLNSTLIHSAVSKNSIPQDIKEGLSNLQNELSKYNGKDSYLKRSFKFLSDGIKDILKSISNMFGISQLNGHNNNPTLLEKLESTSQMSLDIKALKETVNLTNKTFKKFQDQNLSISR